MDLYVEHLPENKHIYAVADEFAERAHLEVYEDYVCWNDYKGEYRKVYFVSNLLFPETRLEWDARCMALRALEEDLRKIGVTELFTLNFDGRCDNAGHLFGFEYEGSWETLYAENYAYRKAL